jgi:diguanylate cyclase (GGDEF)-like protein/PAS domain S-box-containing protein
VVLPHPSEERGLFDRVEVGLAEASLDGVLVSVNPYVVRLFGYDSADELLGRRLTDITDPAEHAVQREDVQSLLTGRTRRFQRDRTHLKRDGTRITVQLTVELVPGPDGRPRMAGTIVDASQRIAALAAAERAQAEAEERRRFADTLLEMVDVGILACDVDGRITTVNRILRAMHGEIPERRGGQEDWVNAFDLYEVDGTTPLGPDTVPLARVLRDGVLVGAEHVIAPRGLPARRVRCDGRVLRDAEGEPIGAVVAVSDITASRRAQSDLAASKAELEQAHAELSARERFHRAVLDTVDVAIAACDADGRPAYLNRLARGIDDASLYPVGGSRPLAPHERPLSRTLADGRLEALEVAVRPARGPERRLLVRGSSLRGEDGAVVGAVNAAHDITALRVGEQALRRSEELFRAAFAHGPLGMCRLDDRGVVIELNPALERLLGLPSADALGRPLLDLLHPDDAPRVAAAVARPTAHPLEVRVPQADGPPLWCELALSQVQDPDGAPYLFAQLADVTARKHHALTLEDAARRDPLTGLGNRVLLLSRLEQLLAGDQAVAVLFVDLDDFKAVNDDHGHDAGDAVLVEVGHRLLEAVRPEDVVARLGGDEFVVVCPTPHGEAGAVAAALAARVADLLSPPVVVGERRLDVRASIGTTVALAGQSASTAVADADAAMYRAKAARRPGSAGPVAAGPVRTRLRDLVNSALDADRLHVVYQPLVDLRTDVVVGVEALLRLTDPAGRAVPPDVFIPVAETTGAIHDMGAWVLRTAATQTAAWKRQLGPDVEFGLGVNLSPRQLEDVGLAGRIERDVLASGLEPGALVLELTEQLAADDSPRVRETLDELRALGAHLAIDDFGTGYASLRYLTTLPVDLIKLDRSLTSALLSPGRPGRIASAIARLTTDVGMVAVAEGIETEAERTEVLAHGFVLGQGYLLSRPLAAEDMTRLVAARRVPAAT